jgi:hypothetical protein
VESDCLKKKNGIPRKVQGTKTALLATSSRSRDSDSDSEFGYYARVEASSVAKPESKSKTSMGKVVLKPAMLQSQVPQAPISSVSSVSPPTSVSGDIHVVKSYAGVAEKSGNLSWRKKPSIKKNNIKNQSPIKTVLDSGCSKSMFGGHVTLSGSRPSSSIIRTASDSTLTGVVEGSLTLSQQGSTPIRLDEVLSHGDLASNLVSVGQLATHPLVSHILMNDSCATVYGKDQNAILLRAKLEDGIYVIKDLTGSAQANHAVAKSVHFAMLGDAELLHLRIGHLGEKSMRALLNSEIETGLPFVATPFDPSGCTPCIAGKQARTAFKRSTTQEQEVTRCGQVVDWDVFGPTRTVALTDDRYGLLGRDRFSKLILFKTMKHKSASSLFMIFADKNFFNRTGRHFEEIHTDGGGEFKEYEAVGKHCDKNGTVHSTSLPYTAQHNAFIERTVRTITECARTMMVHADASSELWVYATHTAVYIYNRAFITKSGKTPLQLWLDKEEFPSLKKFRVWGCDAYELIPEPLRGDKFESKAQIRMFIGYGIQFPPHSGYQLLDVATGKISYSRDVRFLETSFTQSLKYKQGRQDGDDDGHDNSELFEDMLTRTTFDADTRAAMLLFNPAPSPAPSAVGIPSNTVTTSSLQQQRAQGGDQSSARENNSRAASAAVQSSAQINSGSSHVPVGQSASQPAASIPAPAQNVELPNNNKRVSQPPARYGLIDQRDLGSRIDAIPSSSTPSIPTSSSSETQSRYPKRNRTEPDRLLKAATADKKADKANLAVESTSSAVEPTEPTSLSHALSSSDAEKWKGAIMSELNSLEKHQTWTAIPISEFNGKELPKAIPAKFVFKLKPPSSALPDPSKRWKARLVAQGFRQQAGVDYHETFAPVLRYTTLLILIARATKYNLKMIHLDVETAFLNAELKEEIFISLPKGVTDFVPHLKGKILRLNKSLYGLKQAPLEWKNLLTEAINAQRFKELENDPCVFTIVSKTGKLMVIAVFVDDIMQQYDPADEAEAAGHRDALAKIFTMKNLGEVKTFLGMEINQDREKGITTISQRQYINKVLSTYGFSQCRSLDTPEVAPSHSNTTTGEEEDEQQSRAEATNATQTQPTTIHPQVSVNNYSSAVGALQYAALSTRLDIAHAVNRLSRSLQSPTTESVQQAKRVMRYLAGTRDIGITFTRSKDPFHILAFSDSDWAGDRADSKSTTGVVITLAGGAISWISKKQSIVALSSTEAEYIAMNEAGREITWIRALLAELGEKLIDIPTPLFVDNQTAIRMADDANGNHARRKHINVRYHWIREQINNKVLALHWIPTEQQLADVLTKGLTRVPFLRCRSALMSNNNPSQEQQDNNN